MSADILARGLAGQVRKTARATARTTVLAASATLPPINLPAFTVAAVPPVITVADGSSATTISGGIKISPNSTAWKRTGTTAVLTASSYLAAANPSRYFAWQIETDSSQVEFLLANYNTVIDIFVDGNLVQGPAFQTTASGSGRTIRLDWSADSTPRRMRNVQLCGFNLLFGGCWIEPTASVWFPASRDRRRLMAFLGDSYTQSTGAPSASRTYAAAIAEMLGFDLYADGIGSTGWLSSGGNVPAARVATNIGALTRAPDTIVTALGYNDNGADAAGLATLQAQYDATIAALRTAWPAARLVTLGPWTPIGPTAGLTNVRNALLARAAANGIPFIDVEGIITAANKAIYTGTDNVHPNAAGHQYLGRRIAPLLAPTL